MYIFFEITKKLLVILSLIISNYNLFIIKKSEQLYINLPEYIKIIYNAVLNKKILYENNIFTQFINYVKVNKETILSTTDYKPFLTIIIIFYDIQQLILNKKNEFYKNKKLYYHIINTINDYNISDIYKIILIYMHKLLIINNNLKKNHKLYNEIKLNKVKFDNILDKTLDIIINTSIIIYFKTYLYEKLINEYGINYYLINLELENGYNIIYLYDKYKKGQNYIKNLELIKNTFNINILKIKKRTLLYIKNKINYNIIKNPCYLYEFISILKNKHVYMTDLNSLNDPCYIKIKFPDLKKWITNYMQFKYYY